jgi:hypothetical protein
MALTTTIGPNVHVIISENFLSTATSLMMIMQ